MRIIVNVTVVCVLACVLAGIRECVCDDVEKSEELGDQPEVRSSDEDKKDGKNITGGVKRTTLSPNANTTRDSQLLSLLAARRRQLLNGRLATHINTLASLAHKNKNTTFAQLEVRDVNSSIVKRITFQNSSNDFTPLLKLVTTDGNKEIKQDVKPHEIRHLFVPKVYQDIRNRAGFINNRKKEPVLLTKITSITQENVTENAILYIPPEKLENLEKGVELDPEEVFQVDESNHGLTYLLNYSDTENVTRSSDLNQTSASETKENVSKIDSTTSTTTAAATKKQPDPEPRLISNNEGSTTTTETSTKLVKVENEKDKTNTTLFMSDELYNHFRPLESELPAEDMAPFLYFGQKLGGQINDNLTFSPTLSASTKSVNFIVSPPEKRKFNSRYSATEKYKNSSVMEEEVNEDMDVSVVKNVIEKNKVRNTVKGPAPARTVGLVNAYRKHSSTAATTKSPNIAQLNITEPIINVTPASIDKDKDTHNSTKSRNSLGQTTTSSNIEKYLNATDNAPRNYTRTYQNVRRRPSRITAGSSTENFLSVVNTTTEKTSTLVYTAVVTSVSITSSVRGQNKTDGLTKEGENGTLSKTMEPTTDLKENITLTTIAPTKPPEITSTSTTVAPSTSRGYKTRIRIKTTTVTPPFASSTGRISDTPLPVPIELSTRITDLKTEATASKYADRLALLYPKAEVDNTSRVNGTQIIPKNILRRRRPTTTTSTTTSTTSAPFYTYYYSTETQKPLLVPVQSVTYPTTSNPSEEPTETILPVIVTSRTSSESSSKPILTKLSSNGTLINQNRTVNITLKDDDLLTEEVVIEAEKTYTASYVLAGLGFLPVAGIIAFVLRNVWSKKIKEIDTDYEGYFDTGEVKKESPITPVARTPILPPPKTDQKWEFPRNKLRLQTLLGQGNFGQVWKAEADDLTGHDGMTRLVAVKSIKETASQKEKQELLHEIYIMQKIGTHPNVVTLLACCTGQEPYLLIMEYVMCGKLLTYLRERRSRPDRFSGSGALTSRDLTVFAYCVARGMDYIASKGIVHRDLAARNVLVDHNKLCKIADFGMSREVCGNEDRAKQRHALPVRWMAPEALLYNVYNHETDVWAYGILLWEIVTLGSTPYAAMSGREVLSAVTEGYRLERPPHCKPQLYTAMHSCWHADPSQRPTFAALKSQLADLLDNEPVEGNYVDLDSFYQESSVYSDPSAIIHDEEGLSAEYDRERRCFRELAPGPAKYDNRAFNYRDEDLRSKFGIGTPRMGGFGIRDVPFNDRNFSDGDFNDRPFSDKNFSDRNFTDPNFNERKEGKLSTSSFHRERERERDNPLVSRNSFNGFPRVTSRDFQILNDGRNKRVSEFECDI